MQATQILRLGMSGGSGLGSRDDFFTWTGIGCDAGCAPPPQKNPSIKIGGFVDGEAHHVYLQTLHGPFRYFLFLSLFSHIGARTPA